MSDTNKRILEESGKALSFEEWWGQSRENSPQFLFWDLILVMELIVFSLIRSFKEAYFNLKMKIKMKKMKIALY